MGLKDWRVRRSMSDPVRGEFRVSGSYRTAHEADSNWNEMLTGVLVADGLPPTPAEHMDHRVLGELTRVLPVLVDRADPSQFVVLWDEIVPPDARTQAQRQAHVDAERLAGQRPPDHDQSQRHQRHQDPADQGPAYDLDPHVITVDPSELPSWLQKAVDTALSEDTGPDRDSWITDQRHRVTPQMRNDHLATTGRPVQAMLLAVTDVPVPAYALPGPSASLTDLTLQLPRPDGSTYTVQTRMGFRSAERRATLAIIGSSVPVHVDPADDTHVVVDISAWT